MDEKKLIEIIEQLRSKGQEWKTVDAKADLILKQEGDKAEFVKDVAAMANNFEKSYLVIGLNNGSFSDIGKLSNHYTKTGINQILSDKIDPPVIVDYKEFIIDSNEYGLVEIFGDNPPYIIARDVVFQREDRKQVIIRKGMIFVRHEDGTEGISRAELENILSNGLRLTFKDETELAKKLAFEQPEYWEFLLTAELFKSRISLIKNEFNEIQRGTIFKKSKKLKGTEFFDWSELVLNDLETLGNQLMIVVNEDIRTSWGKLGESGDPILIKQTADKMLSINRNLLDWELEFRSTILPDTLKPLKEMLQKWASHYIFSFEKLPDKILDIFKEPNPSGQYVIDIVITPFPNTEAVQSEIESLRKNPKKLLRIFND